MGGLPMNILRIKALAWLGAVLVGGLLGWEVVDFIQRRPELERELPLDLVKRVLEDEVSEPEPPADTRVDVDDVTRIWHSMSWSGTEEVREVEPTPVNPTPVVVRTAVEELLRVLAIQVDEEKAEESIAYVHFLDPELAELRREYRFQILHVGERLGGAHENVIVDSIDAQGVTFSFDEEGREPEVVAALEYTAEGAEIAIVSPEDVRMPERARLIPNSGEPYRYDPRRIEQVRRNEFHVGREEAQDLGQNYSQILSRDLSYKTARGRNGQVVGIQITRVSPNSLPARAGLEPGEVLKSINGHAVRSVNEAVIYVKKVADTTNTWEAVFEKQGREYTRTYTSPPAE